MGQALSQCAIFSWIRPSQRSTGRKGTYCTFPAGSDNICLAPTPGATRPRVPAASSVISGHLPHATHLATHDPPFPSRTSLQKAGNVVAASGPTITIRTCGLEPVLCNRLLIEASRWAQTVHMFTQRFTSHVTQYSRRSLNAFFCSSYCACIYDLEKPYLLFSSVVPWSSCRLPDTLTVFCDVLAAVSS